MHLEAAQAIFAEYHAMRAKAGLRAYSSMQGREEAVERGDVRLQETTIEIGLQSGVFTSNGALVVSAARDLRKAWEKRIRRDKSLANEWIVRRERLSLLFAGASGCAAPTWSRRASSSSATRRRPIGSTSRACGASTRKALDAATDAWQAGTRARPRPRAAPPAERRPAARRSPSTSARSRSTRTSADAYEALTSAKLTHAERGAVRLQLALHGSGATTKAADLDARLQVPEGHQVRRAAHGGHRGVRRALPRRRQGASRQGRARRGRGRAGARPTRSRASATRCRPTPPASSSRRR